MTCVCGWYYYNLGVQDYYNLEELNIFTNKLYSFDNNIRFSPEIEHNNSPPFLDVTLTRTNQSKGLFREKLWLFGLSYRIITYKISMDRFFIRRNFPVCNKNNFNVKLNNIPRIA